METLSDLRASSKVDDLSYTIIGTSGNSLLKALRKGPPTSPETPRSGMELILFDFDLDMGRIWI
jgi:hypothetical protein